jgi:hypothetical protein
MTGGEIRTRSYIVTDSAAIYKGDPLKVVTGGTVEVAAADDGTIIIGVAAEWITAAKSATSGTLVQVWDDPYIIFGVQADTGTTVAATCVFSKANLITYAAGNTTTGISSVELDASDIDTGSQLKILGKIEDPNNAWGEHVDLAVVFNEHFWKAAVAAV